MLPHRGGGAETYIDQLESRPGWHHERVPLARPGGGPGELGRALVTMPRIANLMREADLVHVHGDAAAALTAALLGSRPAVITTHGLHRLRRSTGVSRRLTLSRVVGAARRSRRVICTSEAERDELAAVLPARLQGRLVVVPNGVPAMPADSDARSRARDALSLEDEIAVVQVGELEPRKDPLLTSRAVALAASGAVPVKLLLAGRGSLEEEIRRLGEPSITLLGHLPDVSAVLRAADIFVLSSRREGMSMALLEAMAHGLAVIASDLPGNREALGDAGVLVTPGDSGVLAGEIARVAASPSLRRSLGEAARARVESDLSLESFQERTFGVYEMALSSR